MNKKDTGAALTAGAGSSIAGDLMMLAATMIFGAMTIFSKQILAELEVFNMVGLRFLIAFAVCFIVFRKRYRSLDREMAVHAGVLGTFLFVSYLCMVLGCKYTTASNAGFMMSLVAFFTPLIIWAQEKTPPSIRQTASIFITLAGVGMMCLSGDLTLNKGDLICMLSALFYAFQMLYTERYADRHDPIVLGTFQLAFVGRSSPSGQCGGLGTAALPGSRLRRSGVHSPDRGRETQFRGSRYDNICFAAGLRCSVLVPASRREDQREADSGDLRGIRRGPYHGRQRKKAG